MLVHVSKISNLPPTTPYLLTYSLLPLQVVTVKVPEAEFEGQTKNRLGNPGVRSVVDQVVGQALSDTFEWHPKVKHVYIHFAARD